jgi:nucleoside-diphosphate-sugar epimerase
LAAGFAARGYAVIALDRAFDADARLRLRDCTLIEAMVQDAQLPEVDCILHGAAVTSAPQGRLSDYLGKATAATLRLLDHTERCQARYIQLSSSAVFADSQALAVDETSAVCAASPYAAAKQMAEAATLALRSVGYDTVVVRLGNLYGPFERSRASRPKVSLLQQMLNDAAAHRRIVVRQPDVRREWTFVPDLIVMLTTLIERAQFCVPLLHLASDEIVTDLALARLIAGYRSEVTVMVAQGIPERARPKFGSCMLQQLALPAWTPLAEGVRQLAACLGMSA